MQNNTKYLVLARLQKTNQHHTNHAWQTQSIITIGETSHETKRACKHATQTTRKDIYVNIPGHNKPHIGVMQL